MDSGMLYDVLIIGGGPAGLTSGIYCSRKKLKNAIISIDIGGQTNLTNHIENYPGTGALLGMELMDRFANEAKKFGTQVIAAQVTKLEKSGANFKITTSDGSNYSARSVILAFGAMPKMLGIPGEDKFLGRGISTCTTCDAPLFKNKVTAVVGGGNSAVEGALELATIASKVYLIHRRGEFRADPITVDKLSQVKNIELLLNSMVNEVIGDKNIKSIKVANTQNNTAIEIPIDGLFIEIGHEVKTDFLKGFVAVNEKNEVIIDLSNKTNIPGIFAAGDITTVAFKQTVISAGEGAKAALECYKYLTGGKIDTIDWT
jgi:thioredoxin-disulfide reductase